MLAVGFLSLLSMGFVAMAMGGGDDDDIAEVDVQEEELSPQAPQPGTNPGLDGSGSGSFDLDALGIDIPDNVPEEDLIRINSFLSELESTPTEEMAALLQQLLDDLDLNDVIELPETLPDVIPEEIVEEFPETAGEETEDLPEVQRPPMGEAYRDPLIIAEELEAERLEDEIAAEEARQPENLVTVTDGDGAEIDDDLVLVSNEAGADTSFTVTAPDGANGITVGYDAEHTFQIDYNGETTSVQFSQNAEVQGPEGTVIRTVLSETDDAGTPYQVILSSLEFSSSSVLTLVIDPGGLGSGVAEVSLVNPADTLSIDVPPSFEGELHLVFVEFEDTAANDEGSVTQKYAFVLYGEEGSIAPSPAEVRDLIEGDTTNYALVAEVYLGSEAIYLGDEDQANVSYTNQIYDFINDTPMINAAGGWASVASYDDDALEGGASGEGMNGASGGGTTDEDEEIREMFEDMGLNPGFFGF